MPDDYTPYIQRHLARNIPLNFEECCSIVRSEFESEKRMRRGKDGNYRCRNFDKIYNGMVSQLIGSDPIDELDLQVGSEIAEVQIRFEVIQRTIDYNIPAKPIYEIVGKVRESLRRNIGKLNADPNKRVRSSVKHRDENVHFFLGLSEYEEIPHTIEAFRSAKSIAERAAITNRLLLNIDKQLEEISGYFNYKMGFVTAGQPSVFATLYAVHALADIFERHNSRGYKASVGMDPMKGGDEPNEYTGEFLSFAMNFFNAVDYAEVRRNEESNFSLTGMHTLIRKHAKNRKKDPDLYKLLHEENADHFSVLEFMKRADAIK